MKILQLVIILFLTVVFESLLFQNPAYAMWIPLSPQELLEQSKTIFVGNVTVVTPVDVQYQSQWMKNGTMKQSIGPETMTLDEYTVHVEEFLQNPQNYDTIKLRQATVSGVPTGPAMIDGFQVGDRVLFYLPKYENQTHFPMQYLPESFKIPQLCNGQDILTQQRPWGGNNFTVIQNGVKVDYGNFTANEPVEFLYDRDMYTLFGKSFDVMVGISEITDKGNQQLFSQVIHTGSIPCQWMASAKWEFTPKEEGQYVMKIVSQSDHRTDTSYTPFSVKSGISETMIPEFPFAISILLVSFVSMVVFYRIRFGK